MVSQLKTFLFLGISLLVLAGLGRTEAPLPVNHDQVATPMAPNASTPIVTHQDKATVHNPDNQTLSLPPKIGGAEENFTKVQTNVFDSELFNFVWCRSFNQTIFALSIKGTVFTSENHGSDWRNFNSNLNKATTGENIESHIVNLIQNERDLDTIIFFSKSGASWITSDCGKTLHVLDNGRSFINFKFHPYHNKQILGLFRKECARDSICVSHNVLTLTEDAGIHWRQIKTFVHQFDWGKHAEFAYGLGSNAIFITKQDDESSDQPPHTARAMPGVSTYFSWDFFKTDTRLIQKGYRFWLSKCCIFVEAYDAMGNRLVYTTEVWNNLFHWKRMQLVKQDGDLYSDFHVLNQLSAFNPYLVATRVTQGNVMLSDVFVADYTNANFTKILSNIVISGTNINPAFQEVPALKGLFLANVYDSNYLKIQQQMVIANKASASTDMSNFIKTMISFDHGQTWSHLRPPTHNNKNVPFECSECTLNLHLMDNPTLPPLYGVKNAPGILIAVGSVGHYLSNDQQLLSTFISEDGGLSWRHIADGPHMYEVGDQGGLIVMAEYKKTTDLVKFSYDLGRTWYFIRFLDPSQAGPGGNKNAYKAIKISNIIMEPSNNGHQFLIVGSGVKARKGYSAHLDFSEYHTRECKGYDDPDGTYSDYTRFVPHTYDNDKCFRGINGYYIRKKPEAKCINPDHFEFFRIQSFCKCTDQDWECDNGFSREPGSVVCVQNKDFVVSQDPPAVCEGYYHITNGYRKVNDNLCQGGVDHTPKYIRCPGGWGFFSFIGWLLWFLIKLVLVGVLLFGAFVVFGVIMKKIQENKENKLEGSTGETEFFQAGKDDSRDAPKYDTLSASPTGGKAPPKAETIHDDFEDEEDI